MTSLGVTDSNAPYNWHPAVHTDKFGETLYFFLVRLREPMHTPVTEQIRDLLQAAGIQFACEYVIFGPWDALVRVWLTPASYNRLLQLMNPASGNNVEEFQGFRASQIHYLWSAQDGDLLTHDTEILTAIAANTEAIESTANDPHHSDEETWTALETEGLILPRSQPGTDGIKFYTALQRTSQKNSVQEDVDAINQALVASGMAEQASLYVGAGHLANYMIRCVAKQFNEVLDLVASFDEELGTTRLRPMTLLIANMNARESDHVNDPTPLTLDENNDVEILGLDDPAPLRRLKADQRLALHGLIVKACALPANDGVLRHKLLRILRASVLNDQAQLREQLSYVLEFEFYFRTRMISEFTAIFGNDWFNVVKAKCEADPRWQGHVSKMREPIPKWTVGTYKFTALACCSFSPEFKVRIEKQLGEDWSVETDNHLPVRNEVSHSLIAKRKQIDSFDEDWVDFLDRAMRATLLCRKCMPDDSDAKI
ncbi:MAG TPA: hypothetical protein VFZ29_10615 [Solirubrobacterales bacterium]